MNNKNIQTIQGYAIRNLLDIIEENADSHDAKLRKISASKILLDVTSKYEFGEEVNQSIDEFITITENRKQEDEKIKEYKKTDQYILDVIKESGLSVKEFSLYKK